MRRLLRTRLSLGSGTGQPADLSLRRLSTAAERVDLPRESGQALAAVRGGP
jgi:hypothetical protein